MHVSFSEAVTVWERNCIYSYVSPSGAHAALSYDYVVFGHASDRDYGVSCKDVILDPFIEVGLARQVEYARHQPFNVIRQAGQDFRMIRLGESTDVCLYSLLISAHVFLMRSVS